MLGGHLGVIDAYPDFSGVVTDSTGYPEKQIGLPDRKGQSLGETQLQQGLSAGLHDPDAAHPSRL